MHRGNLFRTLFSGLIIMALTIWITNQTIPWLTARGIATGSIDPNSTIAALDQGGNPITYIVTQCLTLQNVAGLVAVAAIYVVSLVFTVRLSNKRRAELEKDAQQ